MAAKDAPLRVPAVVACRVLGFSKQAYYQWAKQPVSNREVEDRLLIQVLSWRLSSSPTSAMTAEMLAEGLEQFPLGSVQTVQTDQGIQYRSAQWKDTILDYGAVHSMSRVGNCHGNAPVESFFARLKTEFGRGDGTWSATQFRRQLATYIQWWDEERIRSKIGTSPLKYLQQVAA